MITVINKITSASPIDYAAEELKKYLRMMRPDGGDVKIDYAPEAKDGFRLGLMQDFGLDVSDAEDTDLDDILYIDCDTKGGIIAGSNPRSVLLAVYEYLRQNGCRWLMPTVDGEYIPIKDLEPVKYRHKPSLRYRGWCNEGSESQRSMIDAIEFAPKVGLNVFMLEFRIPSAYYDRHYDHMGNVENRLPEHVSSNTVLQWKRMCETEMAKRGLQFHDIGHGWSADALGIDSSLRWTGEQTEALVPEKSKKFLPMFDGVRRLYTYFEDGIHHGNGSILNFCMSNPEAREIFVNYVAGYAESHSNSDYLHVWLADGRNNHCECEECHKKPLADWYVILLNELDEELTKRKLDTRIVFIAYQDSIWPPEVERIKNVKRFSLLTALGTQDYSEPALINRKRRETVPYVRNKVQMPDDFETALTYFDLWKEVWPGNNLAYDYHFWIFQYWNVGCITLSEKINGDVKAYQVYGLNGAIEDGSQRSFFPTGLAFYTYARTLFDATLSFDEIREDYFSHAFGKDWRKFYDYLVKLDHTFDFKYMCGKKSSNPKISAYYNPEHAKQLAKVREINEDGRKLIKGYYDSEYRVQTVSVRLLELHALYTDLLADALIPKALGNDELADELYKKFRVEIGKKELEFEPFYDHPMVHYTMKRIFDKRSNAEAMATNDVIAEGMMF